MNSKATPPPPPSVADFSLRPTDRLLPIANISKIMKKPIPKEAKVAKDAKELMQKSASEFIAIITCRAKEICENEARKTVTGDDLIRAMDDLDMPYYAELGRKYYLQYRELIKNERMKKHIKSLEYDDLK
ncbi:Nuclear transcription factor Y subunit B-2 [Nosema granulosis]|uniref:Nuclear transcription factor Y subunit B-2 n=1 Tax=Nosema granulosis TaxID=83296 RepID=A0A9P6L074_9MICR|nr:Nuclear transcription factor Y subunit B-2 [Nosema granulosis]